MTYKEASELKNKNEHLIGQKYRGATIEELIIRPTNENEFDSFAIAYLRTMNAELSIQPFTQSDLTLDVVCDRVKIRTNNLFIRTEIENLLDENLEVNL
ncbi:hypothetical protein BTO05_01005 [Winogradskyella sp. PC-19]|uniref:hypothetical protein n=1 Tax=Winogradskyella sp. PC-19 TaxID=754417 RepID=UPI000B3CCE8D|nr:hypothetical protein [Winogradskyella sp. PC-19]ARV08285.1 hypothetical protein BTO05_01005 [Winogradskyella sp. PC-19]RZN74411.1 MAG: hypothetical protein EVB12_08395 [Winogradskyella sp.]